MRIVEPGDAAYASLRSTYTKVSSPSAILLPSSPAEVAEALARAAESGLPLSVRSGGHGLSGRSSNDGGLVIDLSSFRDVEILDPYRKLVRVGAGARWAQVASTLADRHWAISSGDHGNVGVGGLATAGGIGWLARSYGLTIDRIRAVQVVLANGTEVTASTTTHPELFWAMRGAGDGTAVAVSFDIEAVEVDQVGVSTMVLEVDVAGEVLRRWSEYLAEAPDELVSNGVLLFHQGSYLLHLTSVVAGGPELTDRLVAPLAHLGSAVLTSDAGTMPYAELVPDHHRHPNVGQQPASTTNGLLPTLTAESAGALMEIAAHPLRPLVQLRALGGAINRVDPGATAYAHRHQQVLAVVTLFPPAGNSDLAVVDRMLAQHADGAYRNFESRADTGAFSRAFPGVTGQRVRELQGRFDPTGLLRPAHRTQGDLVP